MKTSALVYVAQQLLGKLRTMDQMPDLNAVEQEIIAILQLAEGTPAFQQLINRELMGKRSRDLDGTPHH